MLPTGFLRKLIGFYGDGVQPFVPNYLETTIDLFVKNQERLREQMSKSMQGFQRHEPHEHGEHHGRQHEPDGQHGQYEGHVPLRCPPGPRGNEPPEHGHVRAHHEDVHPLQHGQRSVATTDGSKEEKIKDLKKTIREMEQELNRLAAE
jgi:polyhydroxyalkanoate synthesis regulator protein